MMRILAAAGNRRGTPMYGNRTMDAYLKSRDSDDPMSPSMATGIYRGAGGQPGFRRIASAAEGDPRGPQTRQTMREILRAMNQKNRADAGLPPLEDV